MSIEQESARLRAPRYMHDLHSRTCSLDCTQDARAAALTKMPNPGQELQTESLAATCGQPVPRLPAMQQPPFEHAPNANEARQIEEDDGVRVRRAQVQCAAVIAIHDPGFARHQLFDVFSPFIPGHFLPTRAPEFAIKVNERQAGPFS